MKKFGIVWVDNLLLVEWFYLNCRLLDKYDFGGFVSIFVFIFVWFNIFVSEYGEVMSSCLKSIGFGMRKLLII